MKALTGRSVVITGAGRGLGAAYASLAAAEGAAVVVNDVNEAAVEAVVDRIRSDGGHAIGAVADVTRWTQAQHVVETCITAFGRIDGLVNNAGIERLGLAWEMTESDVEDLVRVNVLGTLYCGIHAMHAMVRQGAGSIVNVTSGAHLGLAHLSAYGVTKGATAAATRCWAVDLAGTGVRVNAVSPLAATRMSEQTAAYMSRFGVSAESYLDGFPAAADNAPVVAYLLCDRSESLSGQIVRIDATGVALLSHPVVLPGVAGRHWTVESVAAAFDDVLAEQEQPFGLDPTRTVDAPPGLTSRQR